MTLERTQIKKKSSLICRVHLSVVLCFRFITFVLSPYFHILVSSNSPYSEFKDEEIPEVGMELVLIP